MRRLLPLLTTLLLSPLALGAEPAEQQAPVRNILPPADWQKIDRSVDRALAWLAAQQQADGSFPTFETGQPAVTSFATMAFISRGHVPGAGPYGETLNKAIDFVLAQQRKDGLLYSGSTAMPYETLQGSHTATYNHAIAGLMLCEAYGMTDQRRTGQLRPSISKAIDFARSMQRRPSPHEKDRYGWRYFKQLGLSNKGESDLSVTGWFLMFYRSAKNAEFEVPQEYVDEALQFVRACYVEQSGAFYYGPYPYDQRTSRAMTGAGLLSLTLSGQHDEKIARAAGQWILNHPFDRYNSGAGRHDRYHYGAYYCSQSMHLLGGEYWRQFYPSFAATLIANQTAAGCWQPENAQSDATFGAAYSTSLAVLALTPPYELLPIYQR